MIEVISFRAENVQLEFPWITTVIAKPFPIHEDIWAKYKEIDKHIGDMAIKLHEAQANYNQAVLERAYFNAEMRSHD